METQSPGAHAKMTMGELKQKYAQLVERTKQQKQKIEQLLENQRLLQNGIAERDAAIESRDKLIDECKQINEESVSRMQLKDFQLAELFNTIAQKNEEIQGRDQKIAELEKDLSTHKEKLDVEESKIDLSRYEELMEENRRLRNELMRANAVERESVEVGELRKENSELAAQLASLKIELMGKGEAVDRLMQQLERAQEENQSVAEVQQGSTDVVGLSNELESVKSAYEKLKSAFNQQSVVVEQRSNELKSAVDKVRSCEELNKALTREIEAIKAETQTCSSSLKDELRKKDALITQMREKHNELDSQIRQLLTAKQNLESEKGAMEVQLRTISFENQRNSKAASNLQKMATDYEQSMTEKKALLESKKILEQQLKSITDENSRNRETLAKLGERCQTLESQNASLTMSLKNVESEVGATRMDAAKNGALCQSITAERDKLIEKHEKVRGKYKEKKQQACNMQRELEEAKSQLAKAKSEAQSLQNQAQSLQTELDLARKKLNEREIHFHNMSEDLRLLNEDTQTNLKLVERELEALKETSEQAQKELKEELQAAKTRAEESEAMLANLTKTKKGNETKVHSLEQKIGELMHQKKELAQKAETLEKELGTVRAARESNVQNKYLKKVLLQFFLQDGSTRTALVPVLLSLVECDENLIQQAQRSWAESNQIISRSFFKF